MGQFRENLAKGRDANQTDTTDFSMPSKMASNQERMTGKNVRTVKVTPGKFNEGNQIRVQGNQEMTGTLGDPLNSYKRMVMPAVQNIDAGKDRSGRRVAPKAENSPY